MALGAKQDQQENAQAADKACSASPLGGWVVACLAVWVGQIGDLAEDSEDLEASLAWVDAGLDSSACLCLCPSRQDSA